MPERGASLLSGIVRDKAGKWPPCLHVRTFGGQRGIERLSREMRDKEIETAEGARKEWRKITALSISSTRQKTT